jgi:hypothetical protein
MCRKKQISTQVLFREGLFKHKVLSSKTESHRKPIGEKWLRLALLIGPHYPFDGLIVAQENRISMWLQAAIHRFAGDNISLQQQKEAELWAMFQRFRKCS